MYIFSVVLQLIEEILLSNEKVIFYVLNNNFSYTHLASAFVPQKDFYYVLDDTDASKILISFSDLFLRQKDFGIFRVLLLGTFACVFDNVYLAILYIYIKYFSFNFYFFIF